MIGILLKRTYVEGILSLEICIFIQLIYDGTNCVLKYRIIKRKKIIVDEKLKSNNNKKCILYKFYL